MTAAPKPDPQALKLIAAAQAAGLSGFKVTRRGRAVTLEVQSADQREADDIAARIERMNVDAP